MSGAPAYFGVSGAGLGAGLASLAGGLSPRVDMRSSLTLSASFLLSDLVSEAGAAVAVFELDAAAVVALEVDATADVLLEVDTAAVFAEGLALVDMRSALILSQSFLVFPLASVEQSGLVPELDCPAHMGLGDATHTIVPVAHQTRLAVAIARVPRCLFMGMPPHEESRKIKTAFNGGMQERQQHGEHKIETEPQGDHGRVGDENGNDDK